MVSTQSEWPIPSAPIRWGAWFLPIGGIVPALLFIYLLTMPDATKDAKGAAEAATSVAGLGSGFLYIFALVGLLFGLMALYAWLANGRARNAALAGLVLSVVSIGLLLAAFGAFVLASAVASDVYLAGDTGANDVITKLSGGNFGRAILIDFLAAIVIALIGGVAFGAAIWRSGTLPKWSGVLFALGFVLVVASAPIVTHIGGVLLGIGGVMIARTIGRGARPPRPPRRRPRRCSRWAREPRRPRGRGRLFERSPRPFRCFVPSASVVGGGCTDSHQWGEWAHARPSFESLTAGDRPVSHRFRRLSPPRTGARAFAPTVRLRLLPIVP